VCNGFKAGLQFLILASQSQGILRIMKLTRLFLKRFSAISAIAIGSLAFHAPSANAEGINYFCGMSDDLPSLYAVTPTGQQVVLAQFTKYYFSIRELSYTPQRRCDVAAQKFNALNRQGLLQKSRLITFPLKDVNLICVAKEDGKSCIFNGRLLTLPRNVDANQTLRDMIRISDEAGGLFDP
jgi:Circadian oscillating protein COP23